MMRAGLSCLLVIGMVHAQPAMSPARFSAQPVGDGTPAGWRVLSVPNLPVNRFALIADEGTTVLRSESTASAATLAADIQADGNAQLTWRWKIDRVVAEADLARKDGDDFAARVYVFFAVPIDTLPFGARLKIRLASLFYNVDLPTAALCYVWDNRTPKGSTAWSPYTDRVRIVVLRSGDAEAGIWQNERRDLGADFRAAFGFAAPAVTGIALGNDTDQTRERVVAHFGDVTLGAPQ